MPTSTQRGFTTGKWESKYLRRRYRAHRNKVAAAKPAIDCKPPPERPHVQLKKKKALSEEKRQLHVIQENLRVLNKTAEIMNSSILPVGSARSQEKKRRRSRSEDRPISTMLKRNTHVLFQWFLHKFGNYMPWWAEVTY